MFMIEIFWSQFRFQPDIDKNGFAAVKKFLFTKIVALPGLSRIALITPRMNDRDNT